MKFRPPANILLRRAQLIFVLAALIPTVLLTAVGIVLLALGAGSGALPIVSGVLVLAFAATAISGYTLGSILVSRGASQARAQNDFLSMVSHELRTPLTSIGLFIESLRDERLPPDQKERCLELLKGEVTRLDGLVSRLLALSQLEAKEVLFDLRGVGLEGVIKRALAQLETAALPEEVFVDVDCEPGIKVLADEQALADALGNLLINAWKYTPPEGRKISISARCSDKQVVIDVSDNGPGVPAGEQRQIFDKFERGQNAMEGRHPGSGLGLAIVRATIEGLGGKIELHSKPDKGTTFRVRLRRGKPS